MPWGYIHKIGLIMRLTTVLLIAAFMQANASLAQKISLSKTNAPLKTVLKELRLQSGYNFVYTDELLQLSKPVAVRISDADFEEALRIIFSQQPLTYSIAHKTVVLKEKENPSDALSVVTAPLQQQPISGAVTDTTGAPLTGVSVQAKGTSTVVSTDLSGRYRIENTAQDAVLIFSFLGYKTQEVPWSGEGALDIVMRQNLTGLDEVVVVGYGTQKKSSLTGAVASLNLEGSEAVPNLNIAQAIQGKMPGVLISTSAGGAVANQAIMIRGRNSILASNSPLIVVDGIPYSGSLKDLNPNDVKSIEVLKDASAAAIYGSRGANGVILVTTKLGTEGKPQISYNGYYSVQRFVKLPDLMTGPEFYAYKMERGAELMTASEKEVYESGESVDWLDLATREGASTEHNLSVSGGFKETKYYVSGGVLKVKGLAVNDDYLRVSSRINLDSKITSWLTVGTRTQLSYDDRGGISPTWAGDQGVFSMNPLTRAYDENGKLSIYPWTEDPYFVNPLQGTLATNEDETNQVITNNYLIVELPFIPGLQYRINAGFKIRFQDDKTYYGRNTATGLNSGGWAGTNALRSNSRVIENILDYDRVFGKHALFLTGVYSFQSEKDQNTSVTMQGFPHDFLSWYSVPQAQVKEPTYSFNETALISQMLRVNYTYDDRYLLTFTGRRDGYSGFGSKTKWGIFPSIAAGWNIANEEFFRPKNVVNELKLRVSYGLNGNQAIGAYETISRLGQMDYVQGGTTLAGYVPSNLGVDNLGWESTKTFNMGLDFGLLSGRFTGDINYFRSRTSHLLLNRAISAVHGFTSITQNIGKTENRGIEFAVTSRNINKKDFQWTTDLNATWLNNRIVSLYNELDADGNELDDVANLWFIDQPIRVNFGYVWDGIWQENEAAKAAEYGTKPGFVKIRDVNGDGQITADDRQIVGQRDPSFIWGMTNTWRYKDLSLSVFMQGVQGVTKPNPFLLDDEALNGLDTRRNITNKNFWTPDNPNNEHPKNENIAWLQGGQKPMTLEKANFLRVRDITLSYDLANHLLNKRLFNKMQVYFTGRNLFTVTKWTGLDPELDAQQSVPLQKEFVVGLNFWL